LALQIGDLFLSVGDQLLRLGDLLFGLDDLSPKSLVLFAELLVVSLQLLEIEWAPRGT
jgi:hypothetical protein